jgi:hypothetical protein
MAYLKPSCHSGTVNIPTREFLHEAWVTVDAAWVKYPTLADAFSDRNHVDGK